MDAVPKLHVSLSIRARLAASVRLIKIVYFFRGLFQNKIVEPLLTIRKRRVRSRKAHLNHGVSIAATEASKARGIPQDCSRGIHRAAKEEVLPPESPRKPLLRPQPDLVGQVQLSNLTILTADQDGLVQRARI